MILDKVDNKTKPQYKNFDVQLVNLLVTAFKDIESPNKQRTSFSEGETMDEIMFKMGIKGL